ncbi:MAG: hypothetical protein KDK66_05620 [Deltaproteobacteria bacterium]|nr:hypothetical protein [Deltaproteobacteria bacterium]
MAKTKIALFLIALLSFYYPSFLRAEAKKETEFYALEFGRAEDWGVLQET